MRCSVIVATLVMILPNPVRPSRAAECASYRRPTAARAVLTHDVTADTDEDDVGSAIVAAAFGGPVGANAPCCRRDGLLCAEPAGAAPDAAAAGSGIGVRGPPPAHRLGRRS